MGVLPTKDTPIRKPTSPPGMGNIWAMKSGKPGIDV